MYVFYARTRHNRFLCEDMGGQFWWCGGLVLCYDHLMSYIKNFGTQFNTIQLLAYEPGSQSSPEELM